MSDSPPMLGLLSDSHENAKATEQAIACLVAQGATLLVHLGDLCSDSVVDALAGQFTPEGTPIPAHLVWGNCDAASPADTHYAESLGLVAHPDIGWLDFNDRSIAITHGHLQKCMQSAVEQGTDFLLHGHLHRRLDAMIGNTRVICAGSVAEPRDGSPPVAALLEPAAGTLTWVEFA